MIGHARRNFLRFVEVWNSCIYGILATGGNSCCGKTETAEFQEIAPRRRFAVNFFIYQVEYRMRCIRIFLPWVNYRQICLLFEAFPIFLFHLYSVV